MKTLLFMVVGLLPWAVMAATPAEQGVHNTSYMTQSGERVLRIETLLPVPPGRVWEAWSTDAGLQGWIAPVAHIDLRTGGAITTHYDKRAHLGDPGTIRLPITAFLEKQLIVLKVNLNGDFPQKARDEQQNLQEIVQIEDAGGGETRIVSSMVGWGSGKEWDQTYDFFARGNRWTYQQLYAYLMRRTP